MLIKEKHLLQMAVLKQKPNKAIFSREERRRKMVVTNLNPSATRSNQKHVEKEAKKLIASSLDGKKEKADAMDAQLDATIQRRRGADVSATTVVLPNQVSTDEDVEKVKDSELKEEKNESTSLGSVESIQRLPLLGNEDNGEQGQIR